MNEVIAGAAISVATAVVTSLLTVRLSVRQFQTQRWWEKKVEAYSQLVESLTSLKVVLDRWLSEAYGERRQSQSKDLNEQYSLAARSLTRVAAQGAFLVSEDAVKICKNVVRALDFESQNIVEELEHSSTAVDAAIGELIELARRDLRAK